MIWNSDRDDREDYEHFYKKPRLEECRRDAECGQKKPKEQDDAKTDGN